MSANTPNPVSVKLAEEFPLLWDLAKDYDEAVNKRGASATALSKEADSALNELFQARQWARTQTEVREP